MTNRFVLLTLVILLIVCLVACNTWPTIIATAQAISAIVSVYSPAVGAYASLAVALLLQAESAVKAYQKDKGTGSEADLNAAIMAIETKLPAELNKLSVQIPAADYAKVNAATLIILDYAEAFWVKAPASTKALIIAQRSARTATPMPKPMSRGEIKTRWDKQVCVGDLRCTVLVN